MTNEEKRVLGLTLTECIQKISFASENINYAEIEGLLVACYRFMSDYKESITAEQQRRAGRSEDVKCKTCIYEKTDAFMELIDEKISRRSITDADVQRAIKQLTYARDQFEDGTFVRSLDLAIIALESYQPKQTCSGCYHIEAYSFNEPCKSCSCNKGSNWMPLPEPPKGERNG